MVVVVNKIKSFVESKKLTPYQFAKDCGFSHNTAGKLIDNPQEIPSAVTWKKICNAYDIDPSELIGREITETERQQIIDKELVREIKREIWERSQKKKKRES